MTLESRKRTADDRDLAPPPLEDGVVLLTDGAVSVVRTRHGDVRAARAASCLVAPAPRDRVAIARLGDDAFVLAILEREDASRLVIASEGPIDLVSRGGDVSLVAGNDVTLAGKNAVGIIGREVTVDAEKASVSASELSVVGKLASVSAGMLRTAADAVERTAGRLVERLGRSYRFIEETEQVRAKELDLRAEGPMSLRAEHAVVIARKIVKVDGTQIHMG